MIWRDVLWEAVFRYPPQERYQDLLWEAERDRRTQGELLRANSAGRGRQAKLTRRWRIALGLAVLVLIAWAIGVYLNATPILFVAAR